MGEAKRRGTPAQRQQEGAAKRFAEEMERERRRSAAWAAMSPKDRELMLLVAGMSVGLIPQLEETK